MQKLSSPLTRLYKQLFPPLWFGGLLLSALFGNQRQGGMHLVTLLLLAGIGYVVYRYLIFDLMDEVWLEGDWLLVKNRGEQSRVPLRDVMNVHSSAIASPRRITVLLRTPSLLGGRVSFMPNSPGSQFPTFRSDPVAAALIQRVDALRRSGR